MCVPSSAPCLKIPPSPSAPFFRFSSSAAPRPSVVNVATTIRSSQTEGPLRRPVAPPLRPVPPSPPPSSSPPSSTVAPPPQQPKPLLAPGAAEAAVEDGGGIMLEFQRQKAKELQQYFKQKKLEESNQGPFFGFISKNEISNGRGSGSALYESRSSSDFMLLDLCYVVHTYE
ncbi:hypothetical protein ACJRO7_020279 [Eucalyptus globulus]|uniref:Uncharacterized protein n=1 Tax=Eucalyptus globulus TaxID=34317 RepID=A0ABD3KMA8_EUCGL